MAKTKAKTSGPKKNAHPERELKNPKHELFCWLYAGYHNRDLFGNATRCYMQAYGYNKTVQSLVDQIEPLDDAIGECTEDQKVQKELLRAQVRVLRKSITAIERTAQACSSELLSNPIIMARSDFLLEEYISHNLADRELLKVIVQDDDLLPKVAAIKEYNRLKDRGGKGKLEGEVVFSWEEDDKPKRSGAPTKKTVTAKVSVSDKSNVEWEE